MPLNWSNRRWANAPSDAGGERLLRAYGCPALYALRRRPRRCCDGEITPSMFAGHSMLCPYEERDKSNGQFPTLRAECTRRMGHPQKQKQIPRTACAGVFALGANTKRQRPAHFARDDNVGE